MSETYVDKDRELIRSRIKKSTDVLVKLAGQENPDVAKMAALERQIAADTKVLADLLVADQEYVVESRKLDLEEQRIELEREQLETEQTRNEIENARNEIEYERNRREWWNNIVRTVVMGITSVIAVLLPVLFDYYKEGRIGERFLLSQKTEEKTAYLTQTDKELVRQGLSDNTGGKSRSFLPWK